MHSYINESMAKKYRKTFIKYKIKFYNETNET